jgi:hypothetical protein
MRETIKKIRNIVELLVGCFAIAWFSLCLIMLCCKLIIQSHAHMEKTSAVIQGEYFYHKGNSYIPYYLFFLNGHKYGGKAISGDYEVGDTIIVEYWPFMPEVNTVWRPDE